jgi:hypothetical protein
MKLSLLTLLFFGFICLSSFRPPGYQLARLKYNGGGDWYGNRTALNNLIAFCNQNLHTNFSAEEAIVEVGSADIFNYPMVYMTGHGNVIFNTQEVRNLRRYLMAGGFLHIDDNYGLDKFIRAEMQKVFPELSFVPVPANHPLYKQKYLFLGGLPKIHEHEGKPAQGFALFKDGRMICYYSYESDLGNGWEDVGTYPEDTAAMHTEALKMGANLISYILIH